MNMGGIMENIEEYERKLDGKLGLVISRKDLIKLGITDYRIHNLVSSGYLEKVARGEYKVMRGKIVEQNLQNISSKEEDAFGEKNDCLFDQISTYIKNKEYRKAEAIIGRERTYEYSTGKVNNITSIYIKLLKKILYLEKSKAVLSVQNRKYNGDFYEIFEKSMLYEDYQISYEMIQKIDTSLSKQFQVYELLLNDLLKINDSNKALYIENNFQQNGKKEEILLTDREVYEMVQTQHFSELVEIIQKERVISPLSRLKYNTLCLIQYMHTVENYGMTRRKKKYKFAESDCFHHLFEAFHSLDIYEIYKSVEACVELAKEPIEFKVYKRLCEIILALDNIDSLKTKRIRMICYRSDLTMEQIEEVREITNTILVHCKEIGHETVYETWVLDILDTIVIAKENKYTNLSWDECKLTGEEVEKLKASLQNGSYTTSFNILNSHSFERTLKEIPYEILITYRYLLSILFKIEEAKKTGFVSSKSEAVIEKLSSIDRVYLDHLQNLENYIQHENYIGGLHYYIENGLKEDYFIELLLLSKTNYNMLDELKSKFNMAIESATKEELVQYRKNYINVAGNISFHNRKQQEQVIEEMTKEINLSKKLVKENSSFENFTI